MNVNDNNSMTSAFHEEEEKIQAKSLDYINKYMAQINELIVIKEIVRYYDKYFQEREKTLQDNNYKAEFIWVWNHHNRILREFMRNLDYITSDFKVPEIKDLIYIKLNEVRILHYHENEFKELEMDREDGYTNMRDNRKMYNYIFILLIGLMKENKRKNNF
jgi:hypothetical protein